MYDNLASVAGKMKSERFADIYRDKHGNEQIN
jgi:hypothetical protein